MHLACVRSVAGKQLGSDRQDHCPINTICYMETMIYTSTSVAYLVSSSSSCVLALPKKAFAAKVAASSKQVQLGLILPNATGRARIQRERSKGGSVQTFLTNTVPHYAEKRQEQPLVIR